jgi:tetratricopeptide (TPR) repeat protein
VIGTAGDYFAPLLEGAGIAWAAVTDPGQRRDIVLQVLAQLPVLWVWDNVEPVTGFPEGTPSDWAQAEQDGLVDLLRDLAQHTRCKVLLTSRRDERRWLGDLPARVRLPPMPLRESLQLATALAARHGHNLGTEDWRPLLRYAAGNPLTVTVVVGQALRDGITTTGQIEAFVARLQAGEAGLEAGHDAELGRTRSLAASLSYGFSAGFAEAERARLAVLHLFRNTANAGVLTVMGDPDSVGSDAVPELAGLDHEAGIALLDRATDMGLLESLGAGSGLYQIHPALPWYFTTLFTTSYGPPNSPAALRATRAYTQAIGKLGDYYWGQAQEGHVARVVPLLSAEEANLRHALTLAIGAGHWDDATGCLQGLRTLYQRTGRDSEWARLVAQVIPAFIDPATDGPLPGREDQWSVITGYRVRLAMAARDWPTATRLQDLAIAWNRERAAAALAAPAGQLTPGQRNQIRSLAVSLEHLGHILRWQEDSGCLPHYREAVTLAQRIRDTAAESMLATSLGNTYLTVPALRDLGQAQHWHQHALDLVPEHDRVGRAQCLGQLARVALDRFREARDAGQPEPVLLGHLNTALDGYRQALDLFPADDAQDLATVHNQLGIIYHEAGDARRALHHYQQAIKFKEARGDIYGAGQTRQNIALLLQADGRPGDALHYARAALDNFQQVGSGAAAAAVHAEQFVADLESRNR